MQGNVEFASAQCAHCKELRKFERPSTVWGMGDLILVLLTLGMWAVFKTAVMTPAFRCSVCGTAMSK